MATELEITKRQFYSDYHHYYDVEKIAIEDCRFLTFVEFLDETDIINPPVLSRANGTYKNGNWSLLGYCCESYQKSGEEKDSHDEFEEEEEIIDDDNDNNLDFHWEYALFNGFFSDHLEISNANKQEITKSINEVVRFIEKTFSRSLINDISETKNLQDQLLNHYQQGRLDRIDIFIVTDSVIEQDDLETSVTINTVDLDCRIYYWDLKKWNDLKRSKTKRLPINIDFKEKEFQIYNVDFIEKRINHKLSYFLSIFPGNLLSDIYDYNKTSVLENNVRVFLSANRKANASIRKTIKENPSNFFSYNNGLSATAESIEIVNGKIIKINDFQIVNGGQTTATIHYANKKDKRSLEDVFVAVKITALKKDEHYADTVSKISRAANTQTAIKPSDFYANNPFLIDIERLSLKHPFKNSEDKYSYYFFERMAGQYNVTKNSRGTEKNIEIWENSHPKALSFNKIDVARWYNTMELMPYMAALSAEKQFTNFMEEKDFQRKEMTIGRYKTLVGFGLLFSRARKLCGTKVGKDYPSIISDSSVGMATTIYAMSYLHFITNGCLDYWSIYENNDLINESLLKKKRTEIKYDFILEEIIKACWVQIAKFGDTSAQEQTKKKACWDFVKSNVNLSEKVKISLKNSLVSNEEKVKRDSELNDDEDQIYFNALEVLLSNNANTLLLLSRISNNQSEYVKEKLKIENCLRKINAKQQILTKKRVNEIYSFYSSLRSKGFSFSENIENNKIILNLDINLIYRNVFMNKLMFKKTCEEFILNDESNFENNNKLYDELTDIIEKFDREYGISIDDLLKVNNTCKVFLK